MVSKSAGYRDRLAGQQPFPSARSARHHRGPAAARNPLRHPRASVTAATIDPPPAKPDRPPPPARSLRNPVVL